ncbi:MAG: bifunctional diaminohydroxyphosphoribosylaminopyrimidine deaminase/5-amino-6-(5-phosphoribosylamino)uracil reductase RibD [Planctomycetota bacterium]|nr:bifunctional diaminohydroxyphosphoribosylaminopyrimidine deaminase/5-amino-6-(5-phosphoribosylamino)uracil reductase RibD [Planctomycetota bacterium]
MPDHEKCMKQALELAANGRGWTSPNPVVGAVVVKNGKVVGKGWHRRFGEAHAEVHALDAAGKKAKGAVLYVTLEPCNHFGKTPPCVDAILKAGVKTVVLGTRDPHEKAAGGIKALQKKKVKVVEGVLEKQCRRLNAAFFKFVRTGQPLVSAKWAMTADGKIATARGDSKWITSPRARAFAHLLRGRHDAVLVGIGTVLTDAPLLTCRLGLERPEQGHWQPRRVILDSQARMPLDAPLWTAENGGPIVIVTSSDAPIDRVKALKDKGAEIVSLFSKDGRLPIPEVLKALVKLGVMSVYVEGGAEVLGSFLDERVVDRAYVFVAPKIVGGREGVTAVRGRGVERVSDSQELRVTGLKRLGDDVMISGRLGTWSWMRKA